MKINANRKYRFPLLLIVFLLFIGGYAPGWAAGSTIKLPSYEKFVLENGLTVYLMEHHEVPLMEVSLVLPAGTVKDGSQNGLAALTAASLQFGTPNYTKTQIQEKLDFLGARYFTFAAADVTAMGSSFAVKDQDTILPLLAEIISSPKFDDKEVKKEKDRRIMQLKMAKDQPRQVINDYTKKFLFGDHPYGNPGGGISATLSKLTPQDLRKFYKANYKPGESALAIVGDFNAAKMKKKITKYFNGWKNPGSSVKMADKPLPSLDKSRILLVNKSDSMETRFTICGPGFKRNNPDFVAIQVVNTILGGRFTSWLNNALRVNAGLTYGVRSGFRAYKENGYFAISSFTRNATTAKAIDMALDVLDRLHTKGIDAETLTSAQNYLKGQYPPRFETAGNMAGLLTDMFVYGYDESFVNDFYKNVDSLTVENVKKIVAKYFPKKNLQFILIGKTADIKEQVKKYGELTEKEIKSEGF